MSFRLPPLPHALYPDHYVWYVFASALDIMVTVTVLVHLGAREVNTFAQWSIEQFGTWGLIALKFLSVFVVIAVCEIVGRRRQRLGKYLAFGAIIASLFPVMAALAQVLILNLRGRLIYQEWPPVHP